MSPTFDASKHLRGTDKPGHAPADNLGSFIKMDPNNDAEDVVDVDAAVSPANAVNTHLRAISAEAGFNGIMPEVFSVARDREDASDAAFTALTADDVTRLYLAHVVEAMDQIHGFLRDDDEAANAHGRIPASSSDPALHAHITAICEEAGLGGIMPRVFGLILDRDDVSAEAYMALTADSVTGFYDGYVGRAIDKVTATLVKDDEEDDAVQAFLQDEFANHEAMSREARSKGQYELEPLTWNDVIGSLSQMPDDILSDIIEDGDTDAIRGRIEAIANRHGHDSHVDI